MCSVTQLANELAESGFIPDSVIRGGIRRLVARRKAEVGHKNGKDLDAFVTMMNDSKIALVPDIANEQHYEVPAEFFSEVLGEHRKYSCCYWDNGACDLDRAEAAALEISCARARLADGQDVLELGCGWGSLSLWMAKNYPGDQRLPLFRIRHHKKNISTNRQKSVD